MVAYLTDQQIDTRALAHRRELGFRDDQFIDGMTLIIKLKTRYPELNYARVPDAEWTGIDDAKWDSDKKCIYLRESVFCDVNADGPRARMTLLHEVAHALLGHKGLLSRAPVGNLAEKYSADVKRMEYQAKRYAAAFLMPDLPQNRLLGSHQLSEKYHTSGQAASIRVANFAECRLCR